MEEHDCTTYPPNPDCMGNGTVPPPVTPVDTGDVLANTGTGDMIIFIAIFAIAMIVVGLLGRYLGRNK